MWRRHLKDESFEESTCSNSPIVGGTDKTKLLFYVDSTSSSSQAELLLKYILEIRQKIIFSVNKTFAPS